MLNIYIMQNNQKTPHFEVSEGTANLVQAYHELKSKLNQVTKFVSVYYKTNNALESEDLAVELEDSAENLLISLRNCLFENILTEIESGEDFI